MGKRIARRGPKIGRSVLVWARVTREVQDAIIREAESRGTTISQVCSEILTKHYNLPPFVNWDG